MKYFVIKEWEGPGPVVTFRFKDSYLVNEYFLYVDYVEQIQYVFLKYNKKFFIAGISRYSNKILKEILKDLYRYQYPALSAEILEELRKILKYNLCLSSDTELIIEGV